jgi:hypothetical protein
MIVERVTDTLIMATIIVIIFSGNGFIEITLRLYNGGYGSKPQGPGGSLKRDSFVIFIIVIMDVHEKDLRDLKDLRGSFRFTLSYQKKRLFLTALYSSAVLCNLSTIFHKTGSDSCLQQK